MRLAKARTEVGKELLRGVLPSVGPIRYSDHVENSGKEMFDSVSQMRLEGIVAKRRASRYHPGRRTDAWIKIKRQQQLHCVILGFLPAGWVPSTAFLPVRFDASDASRFHSSSRTS